eukprot:UC1_evm2s946
MEQAFDMVKEDVKIDEAAQLEIANLKRQLAESQEQNKQMTEVVEEYSEAMGKMIQQQQSDKDGESKLVAKLRSDIQQGEDDLRKTETAFSDLHRKYEKTKGIVDNLRSNEAKLKDAVKDAQAKLHQSEAKYQKLREHAEGRIQTANESIAGVRDEYKGEISGLTAKLKKATLDMNRIQRQLEAKEADNKELTAICDDLVAQLDGRGA